jgi:alpha-aminoadipate/glutamate carrier protein LysW
VAANCPECDAQLSLTDIVKGEIVVCPDCGMDLEVMEIQPEIVLALAPMEAEDWGE